MYPNPGSTPGMRVAAVQGGGEHRRALSTPDREEESPVYPHPAFVAGIDAAASGRRRMPPPCFRPQGGGERPDP